MKRLSVFGICALACALSLPAQAHGGWGHGGGYGRGYGGWHRGYDGGWVAPLIGAAVVGSLVYAATAPVYAASPVVAMPMQPAVAPVRVAYYCSSYAAYYPSVATCPVPWQQVAY